MKKTLMTCLAIVAVFAVASSAVAITCTVDQHPAATLLVPYFQVSYTPDGTLISSGPGARDVIVTFGNASTAPMIAHVSVFTRESALALDFDVALTGFDLQSFRMSDILSGVLPTSGDTVGYDVCQRNPVATVYPATAGFLRVKPLFPANAAQDNRFATTNYNVPAFGSALSAQLIDSLRTNCNGDTDLLATGYITIDHANYCTLSNPSFSNYFTQDAAGMENNLFGEIIFTSGEGIPTYGMSTVNLEADDAFGTVAQANIDGAPVRTFYARYWNDGANGGDVAPAVCPNCGPCGVGNDENLLNCNAPWDIGYGDQREPLGLKYAARWFDLVAPGTGNTITSNFRVWRAGTDFNGNCTNPEPIATVAFYDEDENGFGVSDPGCVSGIDPTCGQSSNLLPLETQQVNISLFAHPSANAGWVTLGFYQTAADGGTAFDQAWVDYSFEGLLAFESVLVPGTQLDPTTCNPLGLEPPATTVVTPAISTIPTGTGS
jgi:hypothetical protein